MENNFKELEKALWVAVFARHITDEAMRCGRTNEQFASDAAMAANTAVERLRVYLLGKPQWHGNAETIEFMKGVWGD